VQINRSIRKLLLLSSLLSIPLLAFGQQGSSPSLSAHDKVQDCLRKLWGKPVFWDIRAVAQVALSVCDAPPEQLDDALKGQRLRAFHLPNAIFLTSIDSFTPSGAGLYYHWKTPAIDIRALPLTLPGSRKPAEAELRQISDAILERSHLVPLSYPFADDSNGIGKLAVTIKIDIHKMHTGSERESAVALVVDTDAEHEFILGTGRIVYGDLEETGFKYLWETPLLYSSDGRWDYVDLLRNGNLQVSMLSSWGDHRQYDLFYAFDLDGSEITRQTDTCDVMDILSLDRQRKTTVCPIFAKELDVVAAGKGPKEIRVVDDSANHVEPTKAVQRLLYAYRNGRYQVVDSAPVKGSASLSTVVINEQGVELMKEGKYEEASDKFYEAYLRNDDAGTASCLYTNNLGFAYYKMGKYEDAVNYLKEAVECDSGRAVAYLNLGDAYAKLNRNVEARQAYAKYLELAPDSKSAPAVKKKLEDLTRTPQKH